ncbi:flagellar basal body P-ring formation protein FlgA [Gluconacetobacter azotocaptans]|uniref:Flagellar basal body P-ring formation protein FlgA n=2 Tax=Gluconacetobacter azotocaptans TaxID=142834 RepID=A0A7W4JR96_9PROT|nr:flagellar basal body P-ring formation protein FlgA [Gluconacetobacter azotocaptans]MBM9402636.1 flagellar basal body P-ring formation protein FlgA [Gluconacetobacter azotocaptans]
MTVCTATLSAATLRSATVITSDVVKLSDLFADLEPRQDKIIGPAPKPGASIYVGGRQLIAIADQYGVDWLDESPSAMATITRSGRVLDKEFFVGLVQKSLPDIGTGPVSIDLADFHPITVASDDPKPVVLSDVDWDQRTGRFSATVYRTHPTGDITQDSFLLTGIVRAPRRVLVFSRSLPAGAVISASDVNIDESYTGYATAKIFTDETEVDGMTLLHTVVAGEPVLERDLHRTVLMHKGDPVLIVFTAPGVHLTATGRALEDGGNGQYVHALNLASSMIVTGRVAGASQVDVDAGSGAVPSDPNMLRRLTASARANTRSDLSIR